MMRTAGIVLGSLLMLAMFLLVLRSGGHPPPVESAAGEDALALAVTGAPAAPGDMAAGQGGDRAEVPVAAAGGSDDGPVPEASDSGLVLDPQVWNQAMGPGEKTRDDEAANLSRYLVWTPFRSHWAAEGFARRLTLATDVPVEVLNEMPGHYQVVFSYRDEGERQSRVRQIEAVTGLELE